MARIDWHEMPLNASLQGFLKRALQETFHYQPVVHAPDAVIPLWIAGFGIIGLLSLATVLLDRSARAVDRAFTILLLAAILMSPLGWIYYLLLALPSTVGLIRHKMADPHGLAPSGRLGPFLRTASMSLAALLVLCPTALQIVGQPSSLLTVTLGSAHFWTVFFCWFAALLDGQSGIWRPNATRPRDTIHEWVGSLTRQHCVFIAQCSTRSRTKHS